MNRLLGILGVTVVLAAATGFEQPSDKPPAEQMKALVNEYRDSLEAFEKAMGKVEAETQRDKFFEKNHPRPERLYPRFMALATKYPKDASAVDALIWVVSHNSNEPKDSATQGKALDTLRRDHLASDKLPLVFAHAKEDFLSEVLEKSPHRPVRGLACYSMAEGRLGRIRRVTRWRNENPYWRTRMWLRQTGLSYFVTTNIDEVTKESEKLLERVVKDFADVPIEDGRNGKTLGDVAKGHLHEIRHLAIGKPSPKLKSFDLEGKPTQLADLKGKVVVLDVWATWCGPCRAMIPHQRELVKRLEGKPFALVSISIDEKRETVTEFVKKEPMPWAHWYEGPKGRIVADLNVLTYPTIYVLDANGVIRYKDIRGKLLDQAVTALLKEIEGQPMPK